MIYDWDLTTIMIPEAAELAIMIGNINEWQVTIGETTYGGRERRRFYGIISFWLLITCLPQRSKDAIECYQK